MNTPTISVETLFESRNLKETEAFIRTLLEGVSVEILALRASGTMQVESKASEGATDGKNFDFATGADVLAEQLIVTAIMNEYPHDAIKGEEKGDQGIKGSNWKWDIDPIDGTYNFSRGDQCGISVGLLHKGEAVLGVVHFLHDNSQMFASKGHGAFLYDCRSKEESPLNVRSQKPSPTKLREAHLAWDIGHGDLDEQLALFNTLRPHTRYITSDACYLTSVRRVLTNMRDAYINPGAKSYDMAASIAIALEAGAIVSGITNDHIDLTQEGVIPTIIARNLEILTEIRAVLIV